MTLKNCLTSHPALHAVEAQQRFLRHLLLYDRQVTGSSKVASIPTATPPHQSGTYKDKFEAEAVT